MTVSTKSPNLVKIEDKQDIPYILNFGMGVESVAILLRWIREPASRPFKSLNNLILLTAQTGDESVLTKRLIDTYVAPLLEEHNIRWVQVARKTKSTTDGITVLQDTHNLARGERIEMIIDGGRGRHYKLSNENLESGSTPQFSDVHTCALKAKGHVLDTWLRQNMDKTVYGPCLGYNADEKRRVDKCLKEYPSHRGFTYRFPAYEWGWSRADCRNYIADSLYELYQKPRYAYFTNGYFNHMQQAVRTPDDVLRLHKLMTLNRLAPIIWKKSCCTFCPFMSLDNLITRWREEPEEGAEALFNEAIALGLNEHQQLSVHGFAYKICQEYGLQEVLDKFHDKLHEPGQDWALYRVRRTKETKISRRSGKPYPSYAREITIHTTGSRAEVEAALAAKQATQPQGAASRPHHFNQLITLPRDRDADTYAEELFVAMPRAVVPKVRKQETFDQLWGWLGEKPEQRSLYEVVEVTYPSARAKSGFTTQTRVIRRATGPEKDIMANLTELASDANPVETTLCLDRRLPTVNIHPTMTHDDVTVTSRYAVGPPIVKEVLQLGNAFNNRVAGVLGDQQGLLDFSATPETPTTAPAPQQTLDASNNVPVLLFAVEAGRAAHG